ncbi:MAG: hypothetical protein ACXVB1_08910 [Pseudobdellovibrionaceae bacterium]
MKRLIPLLLLLNSAVALADRRPGYLRTFEDFNDEVSIWTESSSENCNLISEGMEIAYRGATRGSYSHDCDISTVEVLYQDGGYRDYGTRSCSIALNKDGLMMTYVGCGYNNTDERLFLYLDPKSKKVINIEH